MQGAHVRCVLEEEIELRRQNHWSPTKRQTNKYLMYVEIHTRQGPRFSIRMVVGIFYSDICPTQPIFTNTETAMLSNS